MCPAVDWVPFGALLVSALSAGVAILNAGRARTAADRAVAVEERRQARRQIIGDAIDSGSRLLETLVTEQRDGASIGAQDHRVIAWYDAAHQAVVEADRAQLGRLQKHLGDMKPTAEVAERLNRLQDIQDRI